MPIHEPGLAEEGTGELDTGDSGSISGQPTGDAIMPSGHVQDPAAIDGAAPPSQGVLAK